MDLKDILKNRQAPQEPPESIALKQYISKHFNAKTQVIVSPHHFTVIVPNAALASTLRLSMHDLLQETGITKKLYIRIG